MEMRTSKRSYWIQPLLVVGAILVAIGVANAVSSTAIRSGLSVTTVGDSYIALANINSGESSVLGVLLPVGHTVGSTGFGRAETTVTIAGVPNAPRILEGSISSAGVLSGTVRNSSDTTGATTISITFAGSDTGTGSASSGHVLGETSVEAAKSIVTLNNDTAGASLSGAPLGDQNQTLRDSGIVSLSAAKAALRGLINNAGGVDTVIRFAVTNARATISSDSRAFILVYNQTRDTFITQQGVDNNIGGFSPDGNTEAMQGKIRVETGINRVFLVWLGANSDSVGELKKASYSSGVDSVGMYLGTVIINDTSATGGGASTTGVVTSSSGSLTASSDTTTMTLTGLVGNFILSATPVAFTAPDVVAADSATSNETHLQTPIFDFTVFNGQGTQITQLSPGVLTLTLFVRGSDTVHVINSGFRLLRVSTTTGQWENLTGIAGVTVIRFAGDNQVALRVDVNSLPGDLVAVGQISSASTTGGGDNGTCVLDKTLGGTLFAGSFGAIRAARDLALSTGAGRAIVALYYAAGLLLAIGLFGYVAKKVRA